MSRRRGDGPPTVLPFFLNPELQEVGHLGTLALGAHWRLVYWVWSHGGDCPDDSDDLLAKIARLRPVQWAGARAELLTVWRIEDGRWQHDRLLGAIAEANGKRALNSFNGAAGGHAKALKYKGDGVANATRTPRGRQADASPAPVQPDIFAGEPEELWAAVKGRFPAQVRRTWLDKVSFVCIDLDGTAQLVAPSRFVADRVNQQLGEDLRRAFGIVGAAARRITLGVGGLDLGVAEVAGNAASSRNIWWTSTRPRRPGGPATASARPVRSGSRT